MNFKNPGLRTKIMTGICCPLAMLILLGLISIINIKSIIRTNEWIEHTHDVIELSLVIIGSAVDMETGMRGYLLAGKEKFLEPYENGRKDIYEYIEILKKTVSDNPKQVERLKEVQKILNEWQEKVSKPNIALRQKIGKGKTMDEMAAIIGEAKGKKYFDRFRKIMSDFKEEEERLMKIRQDDNADTVYSTMIIIILCLVTAVAAGLILAIFITRSVQKQVGGEPGVIAAIAKEIADKNLNFSFDKNEKTGIYAALVKMTEDIQKQVGGEPGVIAAIAEEIAQGNLNISFDQENKTGILSALSEMTVHLKKIVTEILNAANNVASGSQTMSSASEQLSQGSSEQAASVEQVSSSIEQMTANIRQNADNAAQTKEMALRASENARQGEKSVKETVSAMKEIAKKVMIIEEIAMQTNLLALNASVEAARAGKHGRGFAVVASGVRKLAEQCRKSANEIMSLSDSSVSIAENAGSMFTVMMPDIQKTAELLQEINSACAEQDLGAKQINKAVQQLEQIIQENASASEEMASTSQELSNQAEQLVTTMGFFKIDDNIKVSSGGNYYEV